MLIRYKQMGDFLIGVYRRLFCRENSEVEIWMVKRRLSYKDLSEGNRMGVQKSKGKGIEKRINQRFKGIGKSYCKQRTEVEGKLGVRLRRVLGYGKGF